MCEKKSTFDKMYNIFFKHYRIMVCFFVMSKPEHIVLPCMDRGKLLTTIFDFFFKRTKYNFPCKMAEEW